MAMEKRKHARTDVFLIVDFHLTDHAHESSLGISRNYSEAGFSMESHHFEYKPGQILECTLRHPDHDSSVSVMGKIVWKRDGWYNAAMGVLLQDSERKRKELHDLMAGAQRERIHPPIEGKPFFTQHEDVIRSLTEQATNFRKIHSGTVSERPVRPRAAVPKNNLFAHCAFIAFFALTTVILWSAAVQEDNDAPFHSLMPDTINEKPEALTAAVSTITIPAFAEDFRRPFPQESADVRQHRAGIQRRAAAPPKDVIREKITFPANSSDISAKFHSVIDKVVDILLGNPQLIVKLEGHTDNAGTETYNMDLSVRRAAAVKRLFVIRGIVSSRIKIICFGPSNPVASNDIESGRMENRRVEISVPLSES